MKKLLLPIALLLSIQSVEAKPLILRPFRLTYKIYHYTVFKPVDKVTDAFIFISAKRLPRILSVPIELATMLIDQTVEDIDSGLDFSTADSWCEYSNDKD